MSLVQRSQFIVILLTLMAHSAANAVPRADQETVELELQFIYIGASHCGFCKNPDIRAAIQEARSVYARRAQERGVTFVNVGVAIDSVVADGLAFIDQNGPFDQVVVGGHFNNLAMIDYVWAMPAPTADELPNDGIPQVIVAERSFSIKNGRRVPSQPKILDHAIGSLIPLWANQLAPTDR